MNPSLNKLLNKEGNRKSFELEPTKPNSAGGVGVEHFYYNGSEKEIKYLTFTYVPYNSVGDVVYCTVSGQDEARIKITGPIAAGEKAKKLTVSEDALWYNTTITTVKIKSAHIQYMDASEATIAGEDILSIDDKSSEYYKNIGQRLEVILTKNPEDWFGTEKLIIKKGDGGKDTITVRKHIKHIGVEAFKGKGEYLKFEEGSCLESVFYKGFNGCYFETVELPKTVRRIEAEAFTDSLWLKKVVIPVNCEVDDNAFNPRTKVVRADIDSEKMSSNAAADNGGIFKKIKSIFGLK